MKVWISGNLSSRQQLLIESSFLFNVVTIVRQKHGQGMTCSDICATFVWCPKISQLKKAKPFVAIIWRRDPAFFPAGLIYLTPFQLPRCYFTLSNLPFCLPKWYTGTRGFSSSKIKVCDGIGQITFQTVLKYVFFLLGYFIGCLE